MKEIKTIQQKLREFAAERDWDQYHSPKNLASALSVEAAELLEIFQWLTEAESKNIINNADDKQRVSEEIADIFLYLLRLADKMDIDLIEAANNKISLNAQKYPISKAKGNAKKYNRN